MLPGARACCGVLGVRVGFGLGGIWRGGGRGRMLAAAGLVGASKRGGWKEGRGERGEKERKGKEKPL